MDRSETSDLANFLSFLFDRQTTLNLKFNTESNTDSLKRPKCQMHTYGGFELDFNSKVPVEKNK